MTTELEKEFFDVFGIEEQCMCPYSPEYMENGCEICIKYFQGKEDCNERSRYKYPKISDRKLLEMICILGNGKDGSKNLNLYTANKDEWFAVLKDQYNLAYCAAIDKDFKNAILKLCIYRADIKDFKHQIQQLFKEEE